MPIVKQVIEKLQTKKIEKEKPSFDESVTGKKLFFVQFRGHDSTKYIADLIKCEAPITPVYTTRKLKTALPSLKPRVDKNLTSNVVYKIKCSGCSSCYVGMTCRHLVTRIKEYFLPSGVMSKHLKTCGASMNPSTCAEILMSTNRNVIYLSILEALFIRENKPDLNTKDEFSDRSLRIRI